MLIVLSALLMIAVIASNLTANTATTLRVSRSVQAVVEHRLGAEAGLYWAILKLTDPNDQTPWIADGRPYHLAFGDQSLEIAVQNEAGKINLNQAPNELFKQLLKQACMPEDQAERVTERLADYIDEDDEPRPHSLERAGYVALNLPYGPANGSLHSLSELRRVPGFSDELFQRIARYVSPYAFNKTPDLRFAPPKVKAAMFQNDEAAADASQVQAPPSHDTPAMQLLASTGRGNIGIFTLSVKVVSVEEAAPEITAVVYLTGNLGDPYRLLEWHQQIGERQEPDGCAK